MKVLFLNRVYPPQEGATGALLAELAASLNSSGAEVTVVTSTAGPSSSERDDAGVRVERARVLPFTRSSHLRRALSYLSVYPALLLRALRLPAPDVIVTMTDPPLLLALGPLLAWWKGARAVHWAQDVYPEVAEELGLLKKGSWPACALRRVSTWALRRHGTVVVVGRCMRERLLARGIDPERLVVIPNWAQSGSAGPAPCTGARSPGQGTTDPRGGFSIMYSGNMGLAHDFDAIVEAVRRLEKALPSARFVFVGEGARLPWLKSQLQNCPNARFLPPQPKERLADSLASAHLHLVSMRSELCGLVVPSKVYGALASGRSVIFIGPERSEAALLVAGHEGGEVVSPEDPEQLVAAILRAAEDPPLYARRSANAVEAAAGATLEKAASAFAECLASPMPPPAPGRTPDQ